MSTPRIVIVTGGAQNIGAAIVADDILAAVYVLAILHLFRNGWLRYRRAD